MVIANKLRHTSHVGRLGERRDAYVVFWCGNLCERSLGRSRIRWGDNIKVDRQEIGCGRGHELNLSCSGWTKLASCCEQGNERLGLIKCGEFE